MYDVTLKERIILDRLLDAAIFEAETHASIESITPVTKAAFQLSIAELTRLRRKNAAAIAETLNMKPRRGRKKQDCKGEKNA
ncbi:hypothetical protein LJC32_01120 [Oscillospiraceae bacterium OttesenSCG-928-F05]|nr:hypothetical protein [Oscillospiraceae bacterium OttesenSCG-928-F05]